MSTEIIEAHAEEIPNLVPEKFEVILSRVVNNQLAILDQFTEREQELTEKYKDLKADTREGYDRVKEALRELRDIRTGTEGDRKAAKSPLIEAGKSLETKFQWVIGAVSKIEAPLVKEKEAYEARKKQADTDAENARQQKLKQRVDELKAMGADLDGVNVNLGPVSFSVQMIGDTHEDVYIKNVLPRYKEIFDANEVIRIEQEAATAKETKRLADEKIELDKQKLAQEKEATRLKGIQDKIDADNLKKARQIIAEREGAMEELGFAFVKSANAYTYGNLSIEYKNIQESTEDGWAGYLTVISGMVDTEKERIKNVLEAEQTRLNNIKIQEGIDAQKKKDEDAEIERQKQITESGDKIKYEEVYKSIVNTTLYDMRSQQYRTKMKIIRDFITDLKQSHV